ncbi:uncharacterized protein LOC124369352 [Homalodisca vitripennis]|uniref:uncharacterized protein LOC124369352 n=1 Tax=Homalodisca vitripennis TaxID=197043 RepID=UPI001EE9C582|nr:uncharacterized protein LOC124369352 [Homalodisca vitripennis]
MLDTYLRLDRDIWLAEKVAPAPSLGHYLARLEKLNAEIESLSESHDVQSPHLSLVPGLPQTNDKRELESEEAIQRAVVELQINNNPKNAAEHEEFIANLTRQALKQWKLRWLTRRKQDTEEEVAKLSAAVQQLQSLYQQLDLLLGEVGGMETTHSELELQLDRARSYRDTLYGGELAWREAARLAQAAATLARAGRDSWHSLDNTTNLVTRFRVATDCRTTVQEAALCIHTAQVSLPAAMFPFCTLREISALLQMVDYIYTDLQIPERYMHALDVYTSFHKRASLLSNWIRQMMEDTIKKDVQDVDHRIMELTEKLSNERANIIRQQVIRTFLISTG